HRPGQAGLAACRAGRRRDRHHARHQAAPRPGEPDEPRQGGPAVSAEQRLKELKLDLGAVSAPVANYVNAVRTGNLLFLAGKGPRAGKDGKRPTGKWGREYTAEQAYEHARSVGMDLLAVM